MNKNKLKQLFASARKEPAPTPSEGFAADVLRAIRREPPPMPAGPSSVSEHLNSLFPRLALASAVVIILCLAADWGLTAAGVPEVTDGASQATSQYLFNPSSEDL
jgi:hypothetical protein